MRRVPPTIRFHPLSTSRATDQAKIRSAVSRQRVEPGDVPSTARYPDQTIPNAAPSQKRRREEFEAASSSQSQPRPTTEEEEDEVAEIEIPDELYVTMNTQVVGVQYYKGSSLNILALHPLTFWRRYGRSRRRS